MDISIIVSLYNEEESLVELCEWIQRTMNKHRFLYEVIFVDDGSSDGSWEVVEQLSTANKEVRGIRLRRNYGKSAALYCGFKAVKGDVVVTMDADLQDSPEEIPELYNMIKNDDYDLVSGWKKKRYDSIGKRLPSKFFNSAARLFSGIKLHDFNCGLKAYKQNVVKNIEVYGEMHRYVPFLAKEAGFAKIGEKVVEHQARKYGKTKFGLERFLRGFLDLMTVLFMTRFGKRPMHLFGFWGTLMFIFGFMFSAAIGIQKLYYLHKGVDTILVTENPYFYIALITMVLGTQLFLAGFVAELIYRNSAIRDMYQVSEEL